MTITVIHGDCLIELPKLEADSMDSCCTDPPYHLTSIVKRFGGDSAAPAKGNAAFERSSRGFMNKKWDGGDVAFRPETWIEVLRVLKPGAHMIAMGGTRTYHRLVCAIEDAGFEIRDSLAWLYATGFPKSHDVAKSIDKMERGVPHGGPDPTSPNHGKFKTQATEGKRSESDNGQGFGAGPGQFMVTAGNIDDRELSDTARQWSGWGTALKPAMELCVLARKPLSEKTIVANVLRHGTGVINVDGCRIPLSENDALQAEVQHNGHAMDAGGAWGFKAVDRAAGLGRWPANVTHDGSKEVLNYFPDGIDGSSSRYFFTAKANKDDRLASKHPTVKPVDLIRWLTRLITPPGGTTLDPFAGSGTTGMAAMAEGFNAVLIEREAEYVADIQRRITHVSGDGLPLMAEHQKNDGTLFDYVDEKEIHENLFNL